MKNEQQTLRDTRPAALAEGDTLPESNVRPEVEEGWIDIWGARVHNLKNVDVRIPRHRLTVITGLSPSISPTKLAAAPIRPDRLANCRVYMAK